MANNCKYMGNDLNLIFSDSSGFNVATIDYVKVFLRNARCLRSQSISFSLSQLLSSVHVTFSICTSFFIAYELAISESTVKQHVSAVLRKLGVINRTKAGIAFKNAMHLS